MKLIDADLGGRARFDHLDVGGGVGLFADELLDRMPQCHTSLLEPGRILLDRNRPHPRKTLLCASIEQIDEHLSGRRFDLISIHWVLHHLVLTSYHDTRRHQAAMLGKLASHLAPGGRISVFEDVIDGLVWPNLAGRIVYGVTQSKLAAPLVRRLGGNTAGVGVCFLTHHQWCDVFAACGLNLLHYTTYEPWRLPRWKRAALLMRSMRHGHYWLERQSPAGELLSQP